MQAEETVQGVVAVLVSGMVVCGQCKACDVGLRINNFCDQCGAPVLWSAEVANFMLEQLGSSFRMQPTPGPRTTEQLLEWLEERSLIDHSEA